MQTVTVYLMSLTSSVNYDYVGEIYSSRALAEFVGQKSLTSQSEDFGYAIQPLTVKSDGPVVFPGLIEPEDYLWDQMGAVLFGVGVEFSERRVWEFMKMFFPDGAPKLEFVQSEGVWYACLNGKRVGMVIEQDEWRVVYGMVLGFCEG